MNYFNYLKSPKEVNQQIAKRMSARRKEKKFTQVQLAAFEYDSEWLFRRICFNVFAHKDVKYPYNFALSI